MLGSTGIILTSIVSPLLVAACARRHVSLHRDVEPILQRNCAVSHSHNGVGYLASGFSVEFFAALIPGDPVRTR